MKRLGASLGDSAPFVDSIELGSEVLSATSLQVHFSGLAGRDPATAGDYVGIWQGQPWGGGPLEMQPVTSVDGNLVLGELALAALPYTVAYSAGSHPSAEHIAAVQTISPGGLIGPSQGIHLALAFVGSTSLDVSYGVPFGAAPLTFGHELILVEGQVYEPSQAPLATARPTDAAADSVSFDGVAIGVGAFYTVAYLAGAQSANLAATLTFKVAGG